MDSNTSPVGPFWGAKRLEFWIAALQRQCKMFKKANRPIHWEYILLYIFVLIRVIILSLRCLQIAEALCYVIRA